MMLARLSASGASFSSSDGTSYHARRPTPAAPTDTDGPWRFALSPPGDVIAVATPANGLTSEEEEATDASSILVSSLASLLTDITHRLLSLLFSSSPLAGCLVDRTTIPESEVATDAAEIDADLAVIAAKPGWPAAAAAVG